MKIILSFIFLSLFSAFSIFSQNNIIWSDNDGGYFSLAKNQIIYTDLETKSEELFISAESLIPDGSDEAIKIKSFQLSKDFTKVLLFTNAQRVWRYETRGDYYVLDINADKLYPLGMGLPEASLMFAKFSPDGNKVAYVSERNIYYQTVDGGKPIQLTESDGNPKLIHGTFDWAYEEEFSCLDGFRWGPKSDAIAYWQIDASGINDYYMINNTDDVYSKIIPLEYPKVGETPSAARIGIVDIGSKEKNWLNIPGDNRQNYLPRMEWNQDLDKIIVQQLNRKQNSTKLFAADPATGNVEVWYEESDPAWISVRSNWPTGNGWHYLDDKKCFLWVTEQDGWRHIYELNTANGTSTLITEGEMDIIDVLGVDQSEGLVYYTASPDNATEKYLYASNYKKLGPATKLTPSALKGTHSYKLSSKGKYAFHRFSNYFTMPMKEWVSLPTHLPIDEESILKSYDPSGQDYSNVHFFTITTDDGIEMDGYMALPDNFDSTMQYPIVFNVYAEPAGQTVVNRWGTGQTGLYRGNMARDGYIYLSVEGRGAPAPKGREWRKAIYRNIGIVNIRDQAMACKKLLETFSFMDPSRVAVHGWSGGGSTTLNLLFQYPELYQTGIAVAAVANQLTYDNIYQERYMGLPEETLEDYKAGSPITHAKNLQGNLLYIHGTGDDNVHYQNAEMLINELVAHNKQFSLMAYPNRAHGIYKGKGTRNHLSTLFTNFLRENCPPGGRGKLSN